MPLYEQIKRRVLAMILGWQQESERFHTDLELAEQFGVSRQNVHELIVRSVEKLRGYESALGTAGRMAEMMKDLTRIHALLSAAVHSPERAQLAAKDAAELIQTIIHKQEEDAHGI